MISPIEPVIWGLVGGLLSQCLKMIRHANIPRDERPISLASDPMYWVGSLLLGALGGVFALAYVRSGYDLKPILALNIGASAPLLAGQLTSSLPAVGRAG